MGLTREESQGSGFLSAPQFRFQGYTARFSGLLTFAPCFSGGVENDTLYMEQALAGLLDPALAEARPAKSG
jgi:hypothetical protein